jgi:NADH:ubiquinone oxidoreductase subunit 2 (subunit N)
MGAHVAGSQKNNKKFFLWFDTLVIFSIAGLPPFLLFFIKVEILFGGLRLKLVGRRIRIILFSVILIFIYLNLIISRLTLFLDINFIQLGPQRLKKILISLTALLVLPLRLIMFSLLVTGILTS